MIRLLLHRRSVRQFKGQRIEKGKIDKLLTAGLLAPSSRNRKPWEFIVVDDPDLLRDLAKAKAHGSAFLEETPLGIVIIADTEVSDMCVEDTSIAASYMQLQAERLGLGSCWVQIRERQDADGQCSQRYVRKLLSIPEKYMVEAVIGIGYKDAETDPKSMEELDTHKVHYHYHGMKYPGRFR